MKETTETIQNISNIENEENNLHEELSTYEIDECSSKWLKKNTRIRGWLLVMLIIMATTSIRFLVDTYSTFIFFENAFLFIPSIAVTSFAILTIHAFLSRKPNALFFARCFFAACFVVTVFNMIIFGESYKIAGLIRLGVILIWFWFLYSSEVVEEVIPSLFREVKKTDYIIAGIGFLSTFTYLYFGFVL